MAGKEVVYDNSELKKLLATFDSYNRDLTTEAKNIIYPTMREVMPGSTKGYSSEKIYFIIFNTHEYSRQHIKYWCDLWTLEKNEKLMSTASVRKYKDVCKAVSDALLEADRLGVKLIKKKEEGKHYLTDLEQYELNKMQTNNTSVEDLMEYLKSLIDSANTL
ncbi:hypothetical protein PRCB_02230 [Pantoea rodasii]|uniref:Uncharacterized protein n=1 Tax=Pantoea rodasii TaxID=1076549 RepID=A0A2M9WJ15_9GAMM|nr:hypothetical protein [Pantoea rodasii]ORM64347.1 hypothetical protein HA45_11100 [Pantoea rodasii]PJZ07497.1 hypothetical protein PRCB_02230 [Pantoea rodasii]